jgi:hypothetical protein
MVRGEVTERFADPLERVVVESAAGGHSILRVEIIDQANLLGVLGWLFEHGIELVSVRAADDKDPGGSGSGRSGD